MNPDAQEHDEHKGADQVTAELAPAKPTASTNSPATITLEPVISAPVRGPKPDHALSSC